MNIELKEVTIEELTKGYEDNEENGVFSYDGKLDIRPPYQREFVYADKQRNAVIDTITKNFPLNVMYWAVKEDGKYEVIDGQQRTISICQYVEGDFSVRIGNFSQPRAFHNLQEDEKKKILNYKLMVYLCSGEDSEKLKWFETINIAGEKLSNQELRNAVFSGPWVSDAKRYFSKSNCPAKGIASSYISGKVNRQEYLETAIKWISNNDIEQYMKDHQHDPNASALWIYFQSVISWIETTFTNKREKFMKSVDWGVLYNEFKDNIYNTHELEKEIAQLVLDDEVQKKSGIYPYILTRKEKYLSIRAFSDEIKQKVYEIQKGICVKCSKHFPIYQMEGDHITPWHEGGKTIEKNCQMLCKDCNRVKSGK